MRKKINILIKWGVYSFCSIIFGINTAKAQKAKQPNILFILSDDHTSQAWGIYGGILEQYVKNENIKRLANEGCVLDNCFCTNSISVPSRASIITGAYSHRNGVYSLSDALPSETDNIAKHLQAGGYQTALFGKWHLAKEPAGFDTYKIFNGQGEYINPTLISLENWTNNLQEKKGSIIEGFSTDIVTDLTIEWILNCDKDKSFAVFCHFKATHEPWIFPERMKHLYDDVIFPEPENLMEFGPVRSGRTFDGQQLEILTQRWETASKATPNRYPELPFYAQNLGNEEVRRKTYQKLIKDYLRCAAAIDDNIGRLLDMLDEKGLADNTVVIYVSDQGYFLGEHGFFDKRMMYEESLRMPFVARYPPEIPAASRNKDIILNIDFAALLADYARIKPPELSQGKSFRENLKGITPGGWRQDMYYRYWTHHHVRPAHFGIRTDQYKLIFMYGDRLNTTGSENKPNIPNWEFYDLAIDPHENKNRYNDAAYKEIISHLKKRIVTMRQELGDTDDLHVKMHKIMKDFW